LVGIQKDLGEEESVLFEDGDNTFTDRRIPTVRSGRVIAIPYEQVSWLDYRGLGSFNREQIFCRQSLIETPKKAVGRGSARANTAREGKGAHPPRF